MSIESRERHQSSIQSTSCHCTQPKGISNHRNEIHHYYNILIGYDPPLTTPTLSMKIFGGSRSIISVLLSSTLVDESKSFVPAQRLGLHRFVPAAQRSLVRQDIGQINNEDDSISKFSIDVQHVLQNLRSNEFDPCIPKHLMGRPSSLSYSKTWTLDDWEYHNSRWRYLRFFWFIPKSRLVRRIMPQQLALLAWTFVSLWIQDKMFTTWSKPVIPLSGLTTLSTFVAFLLTLRSNHALSRLDDARKLWSKVVLNTREMSSMIVSFIYPVDKQLALMLGRHVALFGWLLKSQLRFSRKDDVVELVRVMLPNKSDADYVLSQRQKTVAVITRIRQVLAHLGKSHKLTTAEEIALDHTAHALSDAITSTGRIRYGFRHIPLCIIELTLTHISTC